MKTFLLERTRPGEINQPESIATCGRLPKCDDSAKAVEAGRKAVRPET